MSNKYFPYKGGWMKHTLLFELGVLAILIGFIISMHFTMLRIDKELALIKNTTHIINKNQDAITRAALKPWKAEALTTYVITEKCPELVTKDNRYIDLITAEEAWGKEGKGKKK